MVRKMLFVGLIQWTLSSCDAITHYEFVVENKLQTGVSVQVDWQFSRSFLGGEKDYFVNIDTSLTVLIPSGERVIVFSHLGWITGYKGVPRPLDKMHEIRKIFIFITKNEHKDMTDLKYWRYSTPRDYTGAYVLTIDSVVYPIQNN